MTRHLLSVVSEKVLKEVENKETDQKTMAWYWQCKLFESDNWTRCQTSYIFQPKYGTGNLRNICVVSNLRIDV